MQKCMVMFLAPHSMMEDWMKKPEAERKADEEKMQADWKVWMAAHSAMIKESMATGKTMRVTKGTVTSSHNDLMLYSIVEGESLEAVAEVFKDHPHFGIPEATIEIMPIRPM